MNVSATQFKVLANKYHNSQALLVSWMGPMPIIAPVEDNPRCSAGNFEQCSANPDVCHVHCICSVPDMYTAIAAYLTMYTANAAYLHRYTANAAYMLMYAAFAAYLAMYAVV